MIDQNENDLERLFTKYARRFGCLVVKFSDPGRRGAPDRMVITPNGVVGFIEFKSPSGAGRVSLHQSAYLADLEKRKISTCVSNDIDHALDWLRELLNK